MTLKFGDTKIIKLNKEQILVDEYYSDPERKKIYVIDYDVEASGTIELEEHEYNTCDIHDLIRKDMSLDFSHNITVKFKSYSEICEELNEEVDQNQQVLF